MTSPPVFRQTFGYPSLVACQCSGEGREKREGKSLCGGNHITSLLYLREERKKVLTHSCKGILHLHRYDLDKQMGLCVGLVPRHNIALPNIYSSTIKTGIRV